MDSSVAPKTYKLDEKTRERERERQRRRRAADPQKAKEQAAAWYQANRERINEPKRRANFESVERYREKQCKLKGIPYVAKVYVVVETSNANVFSSAKANALSATKEV